MLRLRSNWTVIVVAPSADVEVSALMPAMVESCRSIGAATDAAIVSGLAPGSVAVIAMVGKSTAGSAETESSRYAKAPNTISDAVISVVITGRRIQASEMPMWGVRLSSAARFFAFADRHTGAVGQQQMAVHDDLVAIHNAALKHRDIAKRARHLDRAQLRDVVLNH